MTNFKEQNGMLFKMLDKPVPLTLDAELPVLVRMIQDDSPMGRYNRNIERVNVFINTKFIITEIHSSPAYDSELKFGYAKSNCIARVEQLETIGIPVEEGSAEWTLYQMMQGNKVRHESFSMPKVHCAMNEKRQIAIFTTPSSMIDGGDVICHANDWLTSRQVDAMIDERFGWQIYEHEQPKPKYRVGDSVICEYHRSPLPKQVSYERIIDINDVTIVTQSQNGSVCEYDINGNHGDINGWHIDRVISPSEHIITIGCLSGTVEPVSINGIHIWFQLIDVNDRIIATIRISSLDTQTREIVEGLLKAQMEEK